MATTTQPAPSLPTTLAWCTRSSRCAKLRATSASPSRITVFPRLGRQATVPFIGFAEAYVLGAFRRAGVPLQRIRPAVDVLRREIGIEHALASERLFTDGAEVLFDYAEQRDEKDLLDLVVVRTGQHQFSDLARRLRHDPERGRGRPASIR
jgi:hypothetical protein